MTVIWLWLELAIFVALSYIHLNRRARHGHDYGTCPSPPRTFPGPMNGTSLVMRDVIVKVTPRTRLGLPEELCTRGTYL